MIGQIFFARSKKFEPNQSSLLSSSPAKLLVVILVLLLGYVSAVLVCMVSKYDQIGGPVGSCKIQVLEQARSPGPKAWLGCAH